jgi:SAM-dependent methyltransferase
MLIDTDFLRDLRERVVVAERTRLTEIHPRDNMHAKGHEVAYLSIGRRALHVIVEALVVSGARGTSHILDFPCGYGRVTRWIRAAWPEVKITVGEIDREMVDWCSATFRAAPLYSNTDLGEVSIPDFSLLFCGSLLTHLDEARSRQLLDLMIGAAQPNAVLIFTLHGRRALANRQAQPNPSIYATAQDLAAAAHDFYSGRFAYSDYPSKPGYGFSLTPLSWVWEYLHGRDDITLTWFGEKAWNDHQDVVVLKKEAFRRLLAS